MLELTAMAVLFILYIIPLNIPLYNMASMSAEKLLSSQRALPAVAALLYLIYAAIIYAVVYAAVKYIILNDNLIEEDEGRDILSSFMNRNWGIKNMDIAAKLIILFVVLTHLLLMVFDIRIIVMAALCIVFLYKDIKPLSTEPVKAVEERFDRN
jgi:hypothetical protein